MRLAAALALAGLAIAAAPVSLSTRAALSNACCGLASYDPNGMSIATTECHDPRTTAAPCAHIISSVTGIVEGSP